MADEPPVSEGTTQSRRPLNVQEANVSNVKVTRMDVNTGEIKELQTDLLREICDCIEASSEGLGKTLRDEIRASKSVIKSTLQQNRKEIVRALDEIRRSGGTGGGGGGGSGGGTAGAAGKAEEALVGLADALAKMQNVMQVAAERQAMNITQGESESKVRGRGIAEVRELGKALNDFDETIKNTNPGLQRAGKLLASGFTRQKEQIIEGFWLNVQSAGGALIDLQGILRNFQEVARKVADTFDIAQTGIADTTDIITDSFLQLGRVIDAFVTDDMDSLRDSIRRTGEFVVGQAKEGRGTQFLLEGSKNIEDAAKFLRDTRNTIQDDFNFRRFMSDEEANVAILELLELQKRAGIQGEIGASELAKRFVEQNSYLARIARDSGLSVEQLRKMNEDNKKQLANLESIGVLNEEQVRAFTALEGRAEAAGSPELKLLINQLAQSGNDMVAFAANFPSEYADLTKLGIRDQVEAISRLVDQRDEMTAEAFDDRFVDIIESVRSNPRVREMGQLGQFREFFETDVGGLIGGLSRITRLDRAALGGPDDESAKSIFETVKNLFDNFFPGDEVGLVRALAANTAAVVANTLALVGGGAATIAKKIGGLLGIGKGAGAAAGGLARGAGAVARIGAGALGGLAGVAGAGLLGWEIGGLINRGVESATGGSIGTGIANLFDADETDPALKKRMDDEVARLQARAAERKRTGATAPRSRAPASAAATAAVEMTEQSDYLSMIVSLLTTANELHTQIRDTIGINGGAAGRVGDVAGPSPLQRRVPAMDAPVQAFETALDVGGT